MLDRSVAYAAQRTARNPIAKSLFVAVVLLCSTVGFSQTTTSTVDNASLLNVTNITASSSGFRDPFHISILSGYAYVSDSIDSAIKKVSLTDGSVITIAGQSGSFGSVDGIGTAARFGLPAGVWADFTGVYVTDAYYDVVRRISFANGAVTTVAGSATAAPGSADGIGAAARFHSPQAVWGDQTNLYVCDTLNFTVRKIVISTGAVTTLAGTAGARGTADGLGAVARFYAPSGIWGDGTFLYVADGNSIRKVAIANGNVTTLAGDPAQGSYLDGPAPQARFSFISGLWGNSLSLFVADSGNNVVRRITLKSGTVSTIAGAPLTLGINDPSGVAGDGTDLYIVERLSSNIKRAIAPGPSPNPPPSSPSTGNTTPTTPPAPVAPTPPPSAGGPPPAAPTASGLSGNTASSAPPESGNNTLRFQLQNRAWASETTSGDGEGIQTGYARIKATDGTSSASGMAIFSYRRDGVLVSEATVPSSQWVRSGRLPAQVDGVVNTGLALANPNIENATVVFYFTDAGGMPLYSDSFVLPSGGLVSGFLNQSPFAPKTPVDLAKARTFTFMSSVPLGVTGIRGFTNERSDFLFTTLPVVQPDAADIEPIVFAHFAQGGGWTTQLMLVNPTNNTISGTAAFFSPGSVTGGQSENLTYSIGPRSAITLQPSSRPELRVGWIRVTPDQDSATPAGISLFSFQANGITVTQAAVPSMKEGPAFQLYVEGSGDFLNAALGSVQSGFALSNPSDGNAALNLELFALDGTPTGSRVSLIVPGHGHLAMFLNQLPLPQISPFRGFLRITGSPVAVVGLRGRYNERGDFLITTTSPAAESPTPVLAESVFPYFADGGGYTTQFVLNAAGQAASGSVVFVSPSGEPLPVPTRPTKW